MRKATKPQNSIRNLLVYLLSLFFVHIKWHDSMNILGEIMEFAIIIIIN